MGNSVLLRLTAELFFPFMHLGDVEQRVSLQRWAAELQHCQHNSNTPLHLDQQRQTKPKCQHWKSVAKKENWSNQPIINPGLQFGMVWQTSFLPSNNTWNDNEFNERDELSFVESTWYDMFLFTLFRFEIGWKRVSKIDPYCLRFQTLIGPCFTWFSFWIDD